ncbi:MAG: hypothetical protein IJL38_00035 [Bacteroidales bacterium]|jgi:hypothetical protein|nr:hypothetical protein [Bacteroidales bacterium]
MRSANRLLWVIGIAAMLAGLPKVSVAQTYVGTMKVGSYEQKEAKMELKTSPQNTTTLTMRHVKFAKLMPVYIDVDLAPVKVKGTAIEGNGIVPVSKGKRQEKHTVHNLKGTTANGQLVFECMMGKHKVEFKGGRKD